MYRPRLFDRVELPSPQQHVRVPVLWRYMDGVIMRQETGQYNVLWCVTFSHLFPCGLRVATSSLTLSVPEVGPIN